jgi:hypothetical protein
LIMTYRTARIGSIFKNGGLDHIVAVDIEAVNGLLHFDCFG